MKSQNDLNEKIVKATIEIEEKFPELTKYLNEMPDHFLFSTKREVQRKDLRDYLDSLNQLLKTFAMNH